MRRVLLRKPLWFVVLLALAVPAHAQDVADGYASAMVDVLPDQSVSELRTRLFAERRQDVGEHLRLNLAGFVDALVATLGIVATAIAAPQGTTEPTGPFAAFAPAATLGPVVPGQSIAIRLTAAVRAPDRGVRIQKWSVSGSTSGAAGGAAHGLPALAETVNVTIPESAQPSAPAMSRTSLAESVYTVRRASSTPPVNASG